MIGDINELVFISNRAQSIKTVVSTVYEKAQHSACTWHIAQNVKSKFRWRDMMGAYWKAMDVYRAKQFQGYMLVILQRYPRVTEYLKHQVGFEKWSQCHFPGMRYNITTTNMVESLNNMLINEIFPLHCLARCYPRKNIQVVEQEARHGSDSYVSAYTKSGR